MIQRNTMKGIGLTAGAGMIFGFFPIFTSLYVQFGGDLDSYNFYGYVLTVVFLGIYMLVKKVSFAVPGKSILFLVVAGLFNMVTRVLLTYSYLYLDVGIATTLHFMYPIFAAVLGSVFFRDKMPVYKWIVFAVASGSVSLFATDFSGSVQLQGILLALASAVCFALYMLTPEKTGLAEIDPLTFVFYLSLVSMAGCGAMNLWKGQLIVAVPGKALLVLLLCAIVNNVVGFALQQQGMRYLGAAMAALFSLFEPIFSCIFGAVFLAQTMGLKAVAGILLILLSLVSMVLLDNKKSSVS